MLKCIWTCINKDAWASRGRGLKDSWWARLLTFHRLHASFLWHKSPTGTGLHTGQRWLRIRSYAKGQKKNGVLFHTPQLDDWDFPTLISPVLAETDSLWVCLQTLERQWGSSDKLSGARQHLSSPPSNKGNGTEIPSSPVSPCLPDGLAPFPVFIIHSHFLLGEFQFTPSTQFFFSARNSVFC